MLIISFLNAENALALLLYLGSPVKLLYPFSYPSGNGNVALFPKFAISSFSLLLYGSTIGLGIILDK